MSIPKRSFDVRAANSACELFTSYYMETLKATHHGVGEWVERVGKQTVEKKTHLTPTNRNECGKILWMEKASFLVSLSLFLFVLFLSYR